MVHQVQKTPLKEKRSERRAERGDSTMQFWVAWGEMRELLYTHKYFT